MDAFFQKIMKERLVPGAAVSVHQNGIQLISTGYGVRGVGLSDIVSPDTAFQLASCSKQFTAAAILLLVQQQKASVTDSLAMYFPRIEKWSSITLHQLMTHTSGLADYPASFEIHRSYTYADLLHYYTSLPVKSQGIFRYSNIGYALLGFIIQKITGIWFGDFLRHVFFEPLGMTSTVVTSVAPPESALGYSSMNATLKPEAPISFPPTAAGDGIFTTVNDMAKWDTSLFQHTILSEEMVSLMHTPFVNPNDGKVFYCYGVCLKGSVAFHAGAWAGFETHFIRRLDTGLSAVVLCNALGDRFTPNDLADYAIQSIKTASA
jgi:CubicO group peptidase (beta-lactamase class C family)